MDWKGVIGCITVWLVVVSMPSVSLAREDTTRITYARGIALIADDRQSVYSQDRTIETSNSRTFSIGVEHRWHVDEPGFFAFGVDYSTFEYNIKPAAVYTLQTHVLMFNLKYFFEISQSFHPYLGGGLGLAYTGIRETNQMDSHNGYAGYELLGGMEYFLGKDFGVFCEFKWQGINSGGHGFDPTSYGMYGGLFFVFE